MTDLMKGNHTQLLKIVKVKSFTFCCYRTKLMTSCILRYGCVAPASRLETTTLGGVPVHIFDSEVQNPNATQHYSTLVLVCLLLTERSLNVGEENYIKNE